MDGTYKNVFEISCFGNGSLNLDLRFLFGGIAILLIGLSLPWLARKMNSNPDRARQKRFVLVLLFGPLFILLGAFMLYFDVSNGLKFKSALANNQCDVVQGTVQVLHEEPWGGHDTQGGEHIRVGDKEFTYSAWAWTLTYNKTISHDGELKNGVTARLHYIGNDILKVEIKE